MKHHNIAISKVGTHTVLTPRGALTFQNCEELENLFKDLTDKGEDHLIIDCKEVSLMDSKTLEILLQMHTMLSGMNGVLKLSGMNDVCWDIMIVTRLINILHVFKDFHGAIKREL
jgi:anti-anti-sigma factor